MTTTTGQARYDRTLRSVMWADAFLSTAMVIVCFFAAPLIAVAGVPGVLLEAVVAVSIVSAVLLAAFGAITAVLLMLRMADGVYGLPPRLHLPLPPGMRLPGTRREA